MCGKYHLHQIGRCCHLTSFEKEENISVPDVYFADKHLLHLDHMECTL